jgi:peptidoglycan/xylan/chitin deacetylase (PgdA/CDA1 family)
MRAVTNLTVHGIGETTRALEQGEDATWITVEQFERVADAVAGRSDVRITFDDGNASDVEIALPRLVERGLKAEFFGPGGDRRRVFEQSPDGGSRVKRGTTVYCYLGF